MGTTTGGDLLARTLVEFGVDTVFGVHGGHLDAFLGGLHARGVRVVDCRHEAAAGNAAEGYARATGRLGVFFATSGPGFTNGYAALVNALVDRIPILCVTSSPPLREVELNVLQGGFDQLAAAQTATRWAHRVTTAARVPDLVALGVRHATSGVPGPVVLDVPIDVMFREIDDSIATTASLVRAAPPAPAPATMERIVDLVAAAERPVLVLGGGASLSQGAPEALAGLLDRLPMPTVTTSWGFGVLPPDHPCNAGNPADLAAMAFVAGTPDLYLLVGARRGLFTGGRAEHPIGPDARVVHVDVDAVEPGRIGRVDEAVVSDVAEFLRALTRRIADRPELAGWADWAQLTHGTRGAHAMLYQDAADPDDGLHPYRAAQAVSAALADDDTLVYDGGETSGWINFFSQAARPRSWFGLAYMGGLGVGMGFALGAQAARQQAGGGERVVLVTGDGAVGFHLQEFDTMRRHDLPVITIVFNNDGWGMSYHGQDVVLGQGRRVAVDLPPTRYDLIAESMGLHGERVTRIDDIAPAIDRARESGRPACIDVAISPAIVHPMMDPLTAELPEGSIRIPYYEPVPAGEA